MSDVSKTWCFTLNNYSQQDYNQIDEWPLTYGVVGKEIAPTTGTPHLQGYITFNKSYRLSGVKKLFKDRASWRSAKGTEIDNYIYCSKTGNYKVLGSTLAQKPPKTTLSELIPLIQSNGISPIVTEHPEMYVRYHSGLERYAARLQKPRDFKPTVIWIYGPTGSGKTRRVYDSHPHSDIYSAPEDLKFWDGYENQPVVLFDDFRRDLCKFHTLLKILDRYPYKVNVKNSYRELNSHYIYITSPFSPQKTYDTREDVNQLIRRISQIIFLDYNKCPSTQETPTADLIQLDLHTHEDLLPDTDELCP